MNKIKKIISKNKRIKNFIIYTYNKINENIFIWKFFNFYNKQDQNLIDPEIKEVISFLKRDKFNLFPYEFIKKYKPEDIQIFIDDNNNLKYGIWDNKKIYFKRSCTEIEAKNILSNLLLVQDDKSPHKYLTKEFNVSPDDIVADLGAAEGDFSLSIVDKVKYIYIFEADPELLEALKETFKPWKDKVEIINKYVSNLDTDSMTKVDTFFQDKAKPTFIKVDIEGAEYDFIEGSKEILSIQKPMKIILATYHKHGDEIILNKELIKFGFNTEYSKGYMLSLWDNVIKAPFVRRALIRGHK